MCQPEPTPLAADSSLDDSSSPAASWTETETDDDPHVPAVIEAPAEQSAGQGRGPTAQRCFKLIIAYDGANFYGWQRQATARSVQATLEDAICLVTGAPKVRLLATSRTDAGVHALGQCATFRSTYWRAPASNLPLAINTHLPEDVIVRSAHQVPMTFNPLIDCVTKRYRYTVYASRVSSPLDRHHAWWVKKLLNVDAMRDAAQHLIGEHNFVAFQTSGSPRVSTVRHVNAIDIDCQPHLDGQRITIEIEANGFLYNMVRNIVGTLVQVGRGKKPIAWVDEVLQSGDRRAAGQTAPANGLCLLRIRFKGEPRCV